jgi:hypothetical protein
LFEQALKENRPKFVDYFLQRHHDPLITTQFTTQLIADKKKHPK